MDSLLDEAFAGMNMNLMMQMLTVMSVSGEACGAIPGRVEPFRVAIEAANENDQGLYEACSAADAGEIDGEARARQATTTIQAAMSMRQAMVEICPHTDAEGVVRREALARQILDDDMDRWPATEVTSKKMRYCFEADTKLAFGEVREMSAGLDFALGTLVVRKPQPMDPLFYGADAFLEHAHPATKALMNQHMIANRISGTEGLSHLGIDPRIIARIILGEITEVPDNLNSVAYSNLADSADEQCSNHTVKKNKRKEQRKFKSKCSGGTSWDSPSAR